MTMSASIALSIAGSDPSGGAGIEADLKTFSALGVYGAAVITALTAQNTKGVFGIHDVPADFVAAQLNAVFTDLDVGAVKIGMLANAAAIARRQA
jgi:hydroxymethylpyrimidine/phosphomethylpyrimidine kinase